MSVEQPPLPPASSDPNSRTLIITGSSRGGTSFAASAMFHLGVPFVRTGPKEISGRFEHIDLRQAFLDRNTETFTNIAREFDALHPIWGWKLPAVHHDFSFITNVVRNPHFVFIFKEPLSISLRKMDLKGSDPMVAIDEAVASYERMADYASTSRFPILMVGYEAAMGDLESFLETLGDFCGVAGADTRRAVAAIRADGVNYYAPKSAKVTADGLMVQSPDRGSPDGLAAKARPKKAARPARAGLWEL